MRMLPVYPGTQVPGYAYEIELPGYREPTLAPSGRQHAVYGYVSADNRLNSIPHFRISRPNTPYNADKHGTLLGTLENAARNSLCTDGSSHGHFGSSHLDRPGTRDLEPTPTVHTSTAALTASWEHVLWLRRLGAGICFIEAHRVCDHHLVSPHAVRGPVRLRLVHSAIALPAARVSFNMQWGFH